MKYFLLCFGLGIGAFFLVSAGKSEKLSGSTQLSSYAHSEFYDIEVSSIEAGPSHQEIIENFTMSEDDIRARGNESENVLSDQAQQDFENQLNQLSQGAYPPEHYSENETYSNPADCVGESLEIEKSLNNSSAIADLIQERPRKGNALSLECVSYVMNGAQNAFGPNSLARCHKGPRSEPEREGPRICLTKSMVNVTYNSYMDVAECLGLNPKDILPKLKNESGMLVNSYGAGSDAGVGQLTRSAIEEVNNYYASYIADIETQAKTNPACARVIKHKALLAPIAKELTERCSLITTPENPLKNILYMGILNKINMGAVKRIFAARDIMGKIQKLGLRNINEEQLVSALAMSGYNSGVSTAVRILNSYLDKRIAANLKLKSSDFDFHDLPVAIDKLSNNKETNALSLARSYVLAVNINEKDTPETKEIKAEKIKRLPTLIKDSYKLPFPLYIVYNQNNFDGVSKVIDKATYKNIGAPGYLTLLALSDKDIKASFSGKPYNCSNPDFLKIK